MGHRTLIEVELSAAQFAELLTTMNVGSGVPCTIRHLAGQGHIPDPPDTKIEIDRVQESFGDRIKDLKDLLKQSKASIQEMFDEKATLGVKSKAQVLEVINKLIMEITSNIPFIIDQFNEATERVVTSAKAEVDNFVTNVIVQTGLTQLQAMKLDANRLPEGK
jgi:hypothetical protein